jgi:transposase
MQTKITTINFNGQNVYAGIDIHLKSWKVTIMLEEIVHKTFSQDPCAKTLANYLKRNFPGANYHSAYEAGFCGFSAHRELEKYGISNKVVNPADIPTKDKDKKQKEDKRDSRKIAKSLKNGDLEGIYVPSKGMEEVRGLVRYRKTIVKEISRNKSRIKSYLHLNGIEIPMELDTASQHWSGKFTQWLKTIEMTTPYGSMVLQETLDTTEHLRNKLLKINRELRVINKDSEYTSKLKLIQSVPGVGLVMSITLLSELEDIMRFKNLDKLCSFIGLVPSTRSSGEKEKVGTITSRSNKTLRGSIVESAWIASRIDPSLAYTFNELCKRMKPHKAIIRIAKKLLNRIRYVIKYETEYVYSVV